MSTADPINLGTIVYVQTRLNSGGVTGFYIVGGGDVRLATFVFPDDVDIRYLLEYNNRALTSGQLLKGTDSRRGRVDMNGF